MAQVLAPPEWLIKKATRTTKYYGIFHSLYMFLWMPMRSSGPCRVCAILERGRITRYEAISAIVSMRQLAGDRRPDCPCRRLNYGSGCVYDGRGDSLLFQAYGSINSILAPAGYWSQFSRSNICHAGIAQDFPALPPICIAISV